VRIIVGRWAPEALADEGTRELIAEGASHVSTTLLDTRDDLAGLLDKPRVAVPDPGAHAA
jgi:hypothetical protein